MSEKDILKSRVMTTDGMIEVTQLGRLHLASGKVARLLLTPDGLKLTMDSVCLTNGDVLTFDNKSLIFDEKILNK